MAAERKASHTRPPTSYPPPLTHLLCFLSAEALFRLPLILDGGDELQDTLYFIFKLLPVSISQWICDLFILFIFIIYSFFKSEDALIQPKASNVFLVFGASFLFFAFFF
jgi:hypothetical protein